MNNLTKKKTLVLLVVVMDISSDAVIFSAVAKRRLQILISSRSHWKPPKINTGIIHGSLDADQSCISYSPRIGKRLKNRLLTVQKYLLILQDPISGITHVDSEVPINVGGLPMSARRVRWDLHMEINHAKKPLNGFWIFKLAHYLL
jgi:hypothetical protein